MADNVPERLLAHVRSEVAAALGVSSHEAGLIVSTAMSDWQTFWGPEPGYVYKASALLALVRATPRLPRGETWWSSPVFGAPVLDLLTGINPADDALDIAYDIVAETLAQLLEPAPDCFDVNWPAHKVARTMVSSESKAGDSFVVGDGMGARATIRMVERDGELIALVDGVRNHLHDILEACQEELLALLRNSEPK